MNNFDNKNKRNNEEKSFSSSDIASPTATSQSRSFSSLSDVEDKVKSQESPIKQKKANFAAEVANKLTVENDEKIKQGFLKFDFWMKEFMASSDSNQVTPETLFSALTAMSALQNMFNIVISEVTKQCSQKGIDVSEDEKADIRKSILKNVIDSLGLKVDDNLLYAIQHASILSSSNILFDSIKNSIFSKNSDIEVRAAYFEFINLYKNFITPNATAEDIHIAVCSKMGDDPNDPINPGIFETVVNTAQAGIQALSTAFGNAALRDVNEIITEKQLTKGGKFIDTSSQRATDEFVNQCTHSHLVTVKPKKDADGFGGKLMTFFKEIREKQQTTEEERNLLDKLKKYEDMCVKMPVENRSDNASLMQRIKVLTEIQLEVNAYCKDNAKCLLKDKKIDNIINEEMKILTLKADFQNNTNPLENKHIAPKNNSSKI